MKINQYKPVFNKEEIAKELHDYALTDGFYTEFKKTAELEDKFAKMLGVNHCILVNNGTISISLALLAMGIKAGDKVIVPNITMIATSNAVRLIGAIPVFIDVDGTNCCLDLKKAIRYISFGFKTIKAVIYVTLNGRSHGVKEYTQFQLFCKENGVRLIEDNAQSLGSCYIDDFIMSCPYNGIGSFSLSMPKLITTGQGGFLATNNKELADKLRKLKDFGRVKGGLDIHDEFGINSKFTEMQAILGLSQIKDISKRINRKKDIYKSYYNRLKDCPHLKFLASHDRWCPWFIDIYVMERDMLITYLEERGIKTRAVYPELTSQKVNSKFTWFKSKKMSEMFALTGLWLPSSLDITELEIEIICNHILEFYGK